MFDGSNYDQILCRTVESTFPVQFYLLNIQQIARDVFKSSFKMKIREFFLENLAEQGWYFT